MTSGEKVAVPGWHHGSTMAGTREVMVLTRDRWWNLEIQRGESWTFDLQRDKSSTGDVIAESRLDGQCKATSSCQHIGDGKPAQGDLPPTISHLRPASRAPGLLRQLHRHRLLYCGSSLGRVPQPPGLHRFCCRHVSQLSLPGRHRYVRL